MRTANNLTFGALDQNFVTETIIEKPIDRDVGGGYETAKTALQKRL